MVILCSVLRTQTLQIGWMSFLPPPASLVWASFSQLPWQHDVLCTRLRWASHHIYVTHTRIIAFRLLDVVFRLLDVGPFFRVTALPPH